MRMDEQTSHDLAEDEVQLESGAIANKSNGKIVRNPAATPEEMSKLAKIRWEKHRQAVLDGAIAGANVSTSAEATAKLMEALVKRALDIGHRQGVAAANAALDRIEKVQDFETREDETVTGLKLEMDAQALGLLRDALDLARKLRDDPAPPAVIDVPIQD